VIEWR